MTREEAINYVKENLLDENNTEALETLIPELKKSEDERMKELIIATINLYYGEPLEEEAKQMIAWLEKKSNNIDPTKKFTRGYCNWDCDEKPNKKEDIKRSIEEINKELIDAANKISVKVKDWIVIKGWKNPLLIKSHDGFYLFEDTKGNTTSYHLPLAECEYHLWTLSDAKDGDVLVHDDKPFIFRGLLDPNNPNNPVAYCGINECDNFITCSSDNYWSNARVKPATKEQCDFLFKKMYEADYKWNDEKKELIPIK